MQSAASFLQAQPLGDGRMRFSVPQTLHGAFGGAFGGIVCACALVAARSVIAGRTPNALDARFLRGLPAGDAVTTVAVLHSGRSLTNVSVDLSDEAGRLCARSTISLVEPSNLAEVELNHAKHGGWTKHEDASPWPPVAPIVETIDPRMVGDIDGAIASSVRIPWDVTSDSSAEAVCMAADMAVGPPLGRCVPRGIGTPNPDLSLRFCGEVMTPTVTGIGRMERAHDGIAAISIEAWSGDALVGVGVSTALLLPS